MKRTILSAVILCILTSCGVKYYTLTNDQILGSSSFVKYPLTVDESFQTYVRTIQKNIINHDVHLYLNENIQDTGRNLIEVSYLLISKQKGVVIYITCMPDKYESYYDSHWAGLNAINIYDIKVIDFGKLKGYSSQLVEFSAKPNDKRNKVEWIIEDRNDEVEIMSIREENLKKKTNKIYNLSNELSEPMIFKKSNAHFVFNAKKGKVKGKTWVLDPKDTAYLKEPALHILKYPKYYKVYFKMDKIVGGRKSGTEFDVILFNDDRMYYDPLSTFPSTSTQQPLKK